MGKKRDDLNKFKEWLSLKDKNDIKYLKKNYKIGIFMKHPGITEYDAERFIEEPRKIISIVKSSSHEDRLEIRKKFSKKLDLIFIILNPFNPKIESKFKNKLAIITIYPTPSKKKP